MISVFAGTGEDVDNQLRHCDRLMHAVCLGVVGFGNNRVQTLIVKIDEDRVYALNDSVHGAVMEVEEAKGAAVASFALDIGYMEHLGEVEDVRVEVDAVHAIGDVARKVRQIGVADIFLDLDVFERKPRDLGIDSFCCAVFVPSASCHVIFTPFLKPPDSALNKAVRSMGAPGGPQAIDQKFHIPLHVDVFSVPIIASLTYVSS
jgi:hypothetical protein